MVIADLLQTKTVHKNLQRITSQLSVAGLLLCFALVLSISGQQKRSFNDLNQAQLEFDNGNYEKALHIAESANENQKKSGNKLFLFRNLDLIASSQISLKKYSEAEITLEAAFNLTSTTQDDYQKAIIYLRFAWLFRSQRKFSEALGYSKKAHDAVPNDRQIEAEHYLNTGRILFSSGHDISAIIWLEKAEKMLDSGKITVTELDIYRFLALASSSRLNYQAALKYSQKLVARTEKSQFKYRYRQALFELATTLSATGQKHKALDTLKKGSEASIQQNDLFQASRFQSSLLFESLYLRDIVTASEYLDQLEKNDIDRRFSFEITLGKAVIAAFQNQNEAAELLITELENQENSSKFILPYWKISIAEHKRDWEQLISVNRELLALTTEENFAQDLPGIYFNFAKTYFHLNQFDKSLENVEKSIAFVEQIRKSENKHLSIGLLETYHDAYRLLAQIKSSDPLESFELADFLKARILKDRINDSALKTEKIISPPTQQKLEDLSLRSIDDETLAPEIEKYEKLAMGKIPELNIDRPDFSKLENIPELKDSAIVSYFFTFDKKLMAFVWEKRSPLKTVALPVTEDEVDKYANTVQQKIKNLIFFKQDGKELYDKLLKPLSVTSRHLIIIPDKSIWKIPFQALSPDAENYLIEDKLISYAPSVSILLEQLKSPAPNRQTLQAFANSTYENQFLSNVNVEANTVAGIYGSKPLLNATSADFERMSESADIFHFSMHAQIDSEIPLNSFLGFRKTAKNDGRLTVEELLDIKLKKGSLAFLASCDTNNVLNGEGLVSLAWAMMGSGATTVVSAQWEANDKSTEMFTRTFYKYYKQGTTSAEAMQKASIDLIRNKSYNFHEPYYWADFTLNGDFR